MKKTLLLIVVFLFLFSSSTMAETWEIQEGVPQDKTWTITFNEAIDEDTVTSDAVFVRRGQEILDSMTLSLKDETKLIVDNIELYTPGATYELVVTSAVQSVQGINLTNEVVMPFTIETNDSEPVVSVCDQSYMDMTLDELRYCYGEYKEYVRWDHIIPGIGIIEIDRMKRYYEDFREEGVDPITFLEDRSNRFAGIVTDYPYYEIISYNNRAYTNSPLFLNDPFDYQSYHLDLPVQPEGEGEFLLDMYNVFHDFAIYHHDHVEIVTMDRAPELRGTTFMAEAKIFQSITDYQEDDRIVTLQANGNTVMIDTTTFELYVNDEQLVNQEKPYVKNEKLIVPLQTIAESLGFTVELQENYLHRKYGDTLQRLKISN